MDELLKEIDSKIEEYKDTKGMEEYVSYLKEIKGDLKALRSDLKQKEYSAKARAGILPPEQQEAYNKRLAFFNSKPDLPDYVK